MAFLAIGLLGAAYCLVMVFVLRDEVRKSEVLLLDTTQGSLLEKFKVLAKNPTVLLVTFANFVRYGSGLARGFYEALYFGEQFPEHLHEYSLINAAGLLLAPISLYLGGRLSDYKERHQKHKWMPLICR